MKSWKQIHELVKELYRIRKEEGLSPRWETLRDSILHEIQADDGENPSPLKRIGYFTSRHYAVLKDEDAMADYITECLTLINQHFTGEKKTDNPYDPGKAPINGFLSKSFNFYIPKKITEAYKGRELLIAQVNTDLCNGCGECISACPEEAIYIEWFEDREVARITTVHCTGCEKCVKVCPVSAVSVRAVSAQSFDLIETALEITDEIPISFAHQDVGYRPSTTPKSPMDPLARLPRKEDFHPDQYEIDSANERQLSFIEVALCIPSIQDYALRRWREEQISADSNLNKNRSLLVKAREAADRVLIKRNGFAKGERGEKISSISISRMNPLQKSKYRI